MPLTVTAWCPVNIISGRCKVLTNIGKVAKPVIKPLLKQRHKLTCLDWAK